jgi:hypothetical protein
MGEVINLRLRRKARKREEDAEKAAENRAVFGRRKDEKKLTVLLTQKDQRDLDGKKRDPEK